MNENIFRTARHNYYTPKEIDPNVMNELPISIRQELEEYFDKSSLNLNQNNLSEKSFTQIVDRIDESVLNELPEEMRREIINEKKLRQIELKYPPIGGKCHVSTIKEKHNAFNILMNSPRKQTVIKKWHTETILHNDKTPTMTCNYEQKFNQSKPNIAGRTSFNDIKLMLREWIETTNEPNQIDLDLFQNYLIDLLNDYNAEMVQQLLIYVLLQLKISIKINWNENFQILINNVQKHFRRMYDGATMDLS